MASLGGFNPQDHDTEQTEYPELPKGTYVFEVESAELDIKEKGVREGLKIVYAVVEPGELEGRKMFDYMNLNHPTPIAQEIGNKTLAKLCRAGEIMPEDGQDMQTDDLKFKKFTASIGWGKPSKTKNADGTPEFPAKMEIKKWYFPDQGKVPEAEVEEAANDNTPKSKPAANDNAKPTASGSKPWGKKAS